MHKNSSQEEAGMALMALLAIMLILGMIGYAFVGIVSTHRTGIAAQDRSVKALYLAESGLQIGNQYVYEFPDFWTAPVSVELGGTLGDGTFNVTVVYQGGTSYYFITSGNVPQ